MTIHGRVRNYNLPEPLGPENQEAPVEERGLLDRLIPPLDQLQPLVEPQFRHL